MQRPQRPRLPSFLLLALASACRVHVHARAWPGQLNPLAAGPQLPHNKTMQIVGGTAADIKDFPHQVSWFYDGYHRCGGSILSADWVVTAAHCCVGVTPSGLHEIIAGTHSISARGKAKGQVAQVVEIHSHPKFDQRIYANDIALLRVWPPLSMDTMVRPIAIIEPGGPPLPNEPVTVTGWGLLKENSNFQTHFLQKVKVLVHDLAQCRAKYLEASWTLPDTLMCASADKKDACQGDSGGPLIYYHPDDGKDRLVGIVSSGIGCANKDYAGLYTDLRNHDMRAFITEITGIKLHDAGTRPNSVAPFMF